MVSRRLLLLAAALVMHFTAPAAAGGFMKKVKNTGKKIVGGAKKVKDKVGGTIAGGVGVALHTAQTVAGGVSDVKTAVGTAVVKTTVNIGEFAAGVGKEVGEFAVDTAKNSKETAKDMHKNGKNNDIKGVIGAYRDGLNTQDDINKDLRKDVGDHAEDFADDQDDIFNNGADKVRDAAVDTVEELVDIVEDCFSSADDFSNCADLNPLWGQLSECILKGNPADCFAAPAETVGKYAARFQKIASMAFWEVGDSLIDLAADFGQRVHADCKNKAKRVTNELAIPVAVDFKKKAPFIEVDRIKLDGCLEPATLAKDLADLFSECFLTSLRALVPKVIAIWKDGKMYDEATCDPDDHFAVTLNLRLMGSGYVAPPGMVSAGGSIGLAMGCDHGQERFEMLFGFSAGAKVAVSTKVANIQVLQQVGFLEKWPMHIKTAWKEKKLGGHIETHITFPKLASMKYNFMLNEACRQTLPDSVKDILCRKEIPQQIRAAFQSRPSSTSALGCLTLPHP